MTVLEIIPECDLLFFEAGGQTFATDPLEILRVDRLSDFLGVVELLPCQGERVLVARGGGREFQLAVDKVIGVRRFRRSALRRNPTVAQALGGPRANEVMGVVLDGLSPVLVIDMQALSARATQAPH